MVLACEFQLASFGVLLIEYTWFSCPVGRPSIQFYVPNKVFIGKRVHDYEKRE
jgi:hypothetical protein